ncbi:uncharacterized protein LOC128265621 isoform X1 [Drosophila gunungcola]|uniref:uncharacterized protein LOC128265621 isoform X1 n=1 Tax=Drosophila gunungcola TaxID=103775 RepID=UPI0022E20561|nr:uncharacterized protein LOC128265621 isoform X1 [Drosophila gunungcola]
MSAPLAGNAYQVAWDEESTIKLIRAYQNQTLLWNTEHRAHTHRQDRIDAWMRVASAMDMRVQDIKRKMNSMIAVHRSQLRRGTSCRRWWAAHFAFLMPSNKNHYAAAEESEKTKKCNFSENSFGSFSDAELEDLSSDCEFVEEDPRKRPYRSAFREFRAEFEPAKKQRSAVQEINLDLIEDSTEDLVQEQASSSSHPEELENFYEKAEEKADEKLEKKSENGEPDTTDSVSKNDDSALYMKYVACKLANYPPRIRSSVQFQFNRILYEADMDLLDRNAQTPLGKLTLASH